MKNKVLVLIAGSILVLSGLSLAGDDRVPYPTGYRNWSHVKTMVIEPGHPLENPFQGIHHVYANEKARKGLSKGKFADGSIIAFDLLKYISKDKTIQESKRKLVGIMHKDAKKYSQTGGWGFEAFAGNSQSKRLVNDKGVACFACHAPKKDSGYVFSRLRE